MSGDLVTVQQLVVLHGLIYGATAILIVYNALLALSTRDTLYLHYSALSISVLMYQILQFNPEIFAGWITPEAIQPGVNVCLVFATGVLGTNFLRKMFRFAPASAGHRISSGLISVFLLLITVLLLFPEWSGPGISGLSLVPILVFIYFSVTEARLGSRPALAVLPGLVISLMTGSTHQLLFHTGSSQTIELILPAGSLGTLLFFSIAMGLRIRSVRLQALTGRNRERFLKSLLQASPFPVIVMRDPCANPVFWNQAAQNQYHVNETWNLASHLAPETEAELNQEISLQDLDRKLVSIRSHSGRMLETAISVRKIQFQGRPAFLHLHVDRTAELQTRRGLEREQQALQNAVDELQESTRARDDFIAAMSHEIRTPMSGILNAAELLQESDPGQSDAGSKARISSASVLSVLQRNALRLLHLLNDILDFARIQADRMEPDPHRFSLNEFARSSIQKLEPLLARANLELQYHHLETGDRILRGDAARMRQILERFAFSLLSSRRDGTIRVTTSLKENRDLQIDVSVDGRALVGADPRLIERIANSPVGYRPRTGRELSLAVARGLIKTLDGRLEIAEVSDSTLQIRVSFPVSLESARPTEESRARAPLNLLVFEDNADNAILMKRILEKRGHRVEIAASAREGLESLEKTRPDLILMDLHLPDMDGFQATRSIQKTFGSQCPPVVALSASTLERDKKEAMETGMVGFLSKPIQKEQFDSLIEELFSPN